MSSIDELDIVIRRKSGKVTAGIPQLGLYATGNEVGAAIAALEQKRAAFLADLSEAGVLMTLKCATTTLVQRHRSAAVNSANSRSKR